MEIPMRSVNLHEAKTHRSELVGAAAAPARCPAPTATHSTAC